SVVVMLAASYLNAAILGIPIAVYLLGDAIAVVPTPMLQLLLLAPVAFAALRSRVPGARPALRRVVGTPLTLPPLSHSVAGVLASLAPWDPPEVLYDPFRMVGAAAAPLALVAFGMSMTVRARGPAEGSDDGVSRAELALVVAVRTVIHPLVAYAIARAAG